MLDKSKIRILKKYLEMEIEYSMKNFEELTGVEVQGISIKRGDLTSPGHGPISGIRARCGAEYELDW